MHPDRPAARQLVPIQVDLHADSTDRASFQYPTGPVGEVVAFDIVIVLEPVVRQIYEVRTTVIAERGPGGSLSSLSWTEYACRSQLASCAPNEDGVLQVEITE